MSRTEKTFGKIVMGGFVILKNMLLVVAVFLVMLSEETRAQGTVCARVRIEIAQDLTFERQAFDARMRITNGLPTTALEQVNVALLFEDEFGNPVSTTNVVPTSSTSSEIAFFIHQEPLIGIQNTSGTGVVAPNSVAEIHWLMIPTYAAAGESELGKRYFVGARLTYVAAGQPNEILVTPDFITVRPQPLLELDYFLPIDVRANNPFTLGLRIKNIGLAPSYNTRIESSQPQITQNTQNLLVNFEILGSFIDEEPAQPTLQLDFGNIQAGVSRVGRWVMQSSLSGQFISFSAMWSHLDSLGGRLTSLVEDVRTNRTIRDVLVESPGADNLRDFLAVQTGSNVPRLFGSDGVDTSVTVQPITGFGTQGSTGSVTTHLVTIPVTIGPVYSKAQDIYGGSKVVTRAIRQSDQREVSLRNVWFSTEGTGPTESHYFNLFDIDGGGTYLVDVQDPIQGAGAPVLQFIPSILRVEGQSMVFNVTATDPNSTIPTLTVDSLPLGASFTDNGDGTGTFSWPSTIGQAGRYPVTFRASDGVLSVARTPILRIASLADTDDDGMTDAWEIANFGNLNRDGTGDLDGDGLTDLEEFSLGFDPTLAGNAPSVPAIEAPLNGKRVATLTPTLAVLNSRHGVQVPEYDFELFDSENYQHRVDSRFNIPEGVTQTTWSVGVSLQENRWYYWRVRSHLAGGVSEWNYGKFFVSVTNEAPPAPQLVSPANGETVDSRSPRLVVRNVEDPDGDRVRYTFGLVGWVSGQPQIFYVSDIQEGEGGFTTWSPRIPSSVPPPYVWTAWAYDPAFATGAGALNVFGLDASRQAPGAVLPISPRFDELVKGNVVNFALKGVKPSGVSALTYEVQIDSDLSFSTPRFQQVSVTQSAVQVSLQLSGLDDDVAYYWRARASDGLRNGPWQLSKFRVDLSNSTPEIVGFLNPFDSGRADSLQPTLRVLPGRDPEGENLNYDWEVYGDGAMQQFVIGGASSEPRWVVPTALENFRKYFWRYRARDPQDSTSVWSPLTKVFISRDRINDSPHIRAVSPDAVAQFSQDSRITVKWADLDEDTNAEVRFYLNNQLMSTAFAEDLDDDDSDSWRLPPPLTAPIGTYTMNLAIFDGVTEYRDNSCCSVTITARSPTLDSDGDGFVDIYDNCPYRFNPGQEDRGGFETSTPDGIGDACQCGDLDGNGIVTVDDVLLLGSALAPDSNVHLPYPEKCDNTGSWVCDDKDKEALANMVELNQLVPQTCEAARRGL